MRRFFLGLAAGWLMAAPARAEITVGKWTPLFKGVEYATGRADVMEPRLQEVRVMRVDLRDPDVELFSTPKTAKAPMETVSETTSEFLLHHKLAVAINSNFYAPCCTPGEKDLTGLAISRGKVVSRPVTTGATGTKVLVITRDNHASITSTEKDFPLEKYWTAVAGSDWVLAGGQVVKQEATAFRTTGHPRTAVGISQDGRYLFLMTIDGRQPGWSDGASTEEVAEWLKRFGAHEGLNLDGGGSTAMVRDDEGKAVVLNRPSGVALGSADNAGKDGGERVQRSNGNNFGVFAKHVGAITVPGLR